jgi:hypothetical protein
MSSTFKSSSFARFTRIAPTSSALLVTALLAGCSAGDGASASSSDEAISSGPVQVTFSANGVTLHVEAVTGSVGVYVDGLPACADHDAWVDIVPSTITLPAPWTGSPNAYGPYIGGREAGETTWAIVPTDILASTANVLATPSESATNPLVASIHMTKSDGDGPIGHGDGYSLGESFFPSASGKLVLRHHQGYVVRAFGCWAEDLAADRAAGTDTRFTPLVTAPFVMP